MCVCVCMYVVLHVCVQELLTTKAKLDAKEKTRAALESDLEDVKVRNTYDSNNTQPLRHGAGAGQAVDQSKMSQVWAITLLIPLLADILYMTADLLYLAPAYSV